MKLQKIALALFLTLVLVVSACAPQQADNDVDNGQAANGADAPSEGDQDELVIGVIGEPQGTWDPVDTFLLAWSTVATSVFEGLTHRTNDLELVPGLATEWEYLDDLTLQFKLREGVTFHNGEPFNADAVKFTFDRLLGEEGASGPQQANYTSIDSVEVIDDYTVQFHMNEKDPVLLTKLASYGAVIVPPGYIEANGVDHFKTHPVGTGPFKMTEYQQDNYVLLEKYEDYWQEGLPKLDQVRFRVIPESSTRLAEFQSGAIDIIQNIEIAQVDALEGTDGVEIMPVETPTVWSLRFDTTKPPVDDLRVRRAIAHAIDVDAIIDSVLQGYGERITTFQSKMSFGNNPNLEPIAYDPDKAKQLLAEAGVAEGIELDVFIRGNSDTFKEFTQAVQSYLSEVGISLNIHPADSSTLVSDLIPNGEAGHMYHNGWGGWTLDFDNTAYLMYHEGETWNPDFKNEEVERLLEAERTTLDQDEREAIFMELTEKLYELQPEVNLYNAVNIWGVNERVKNFQAPHDDRIQLHEVELN